MPTNTVGDRTLLAGLTLQRQHKITWLNATVPLGTAGQFTEINLAGSGFTTTLSGTGNKRLTITFAGGSQSGIQFQDEGGNLGTSGTVDTLNFVGTSVIASRVGNVVTVTVSALPVGANPTASVGLAVVNGVATTFMRSDAAPPLDQSISPTWTGAHIHNGALTIGADTYFNGVISPAALGLGNNNDYNPASLATANILRLTPNAGGSTLTGITAPASASKVMYLINALGLGTLTLSQADTNSLAANRFSIGASVTLNTGQAVAVWYDGVTARWRLLDTVVSTSVPVTTKGDLFGYNTAPARVPVGADGTVLTADSTNALGVSYQVPTLPQFPLFVGGNGEDGAATFDGTNTFAFATKSGNDYTLNRNVALSTVKVTTGCTLRIDTWRTWIQTWDCRTGFYGQIHGNALNGLAGATSNPGSAVATSATQIYFAPNNTSGSTQGSGGGITSSSSPAAPTNLSTSFGGAGGAGGKGGNAGANTGAAGSTGATTAGYQPVMATIGGFYNDGITASVLVVSPKGGAAGGSGAGGAGDGTTSGGGGGSGGTGAQGADLQIGEIITDGSTPASMCNFRGGVGGNGATRGAGNTGGGGAGGGGGGGPLHVVLGKHVTGAAVTGFFDASGGLGGNAGNGTGTGLAGVGGTGGQSGRIWLFRFDGGATPWSTGTIASGSAPSGVTGGAGGVCTLNLT